MCVKEKWSIPKRVCTRGRLRPSEKKGWFEKEAADDKDEVLLRPSSESERHSFYHKEDFFFGREKLFVKQQWGDEKESGSSGRRFVKKNI